MTEPKNILIVEDEDTTMRSLLLALKSGGYEATCAHTGAEALQLLKDKDTSDNPIDFIVYDIRLSDMTGLDLIEKVDAEGSSLPSLAITGFASREVTEALRQAGRELLEKPFQRAQLYEKIRSIMAGQDNK